MDRKEAIKILASDPPAVENIPTGVKENVYFIFDNTLNVQRQEKHMKNQFCDDCGSWVIGASNTDYFVIGHDDTLTEVFVRNNVLGTITCKRVNGKRERQFAALSALPDDCEIIALHRAYAKHTRNSKYQRRISWIGDRAMAEYIGTFPDHTPHLDKTSLPPSATTAPLKPPLTTSNNTDTLVTHTATTQQQDISINVDEIIYATGGDDLKGRFMERDETITILRTHTTATPHIPTGVKENKFYVFDNSVNVQRRQGNLKNQFWDDCGAWASGASNISLVMLDQGNTLIEVFRKDNQYGTMSGKRVNGKRERHFTALSVQPDDSKIIVLHRTYAKHTQDANYQRRLSWIENNSNAIAEYIGIFPGRAPHGSSVRRGDYIRTKPHIIEKIAEQSKHCAPSTIWQNLEQKIEIGGPRSRKQIANSRYREQKRQQQTSQTHQGNFTDHIQNIQSMAQTHEFVQRVEIGKDKVPAVILYTDEQLQDIKRFCCCGPSSDSTVLGFDKTFNLGDLHVTLGVYKNLSVKRRDSDGHPLFVGPLFLHGNSDFTSYHSFFAHLSAKLHGLPSQPVFGTDDEIAMKKAIQATFPDCRIVSCTRHLKKNIEEHLQNKIGICHKDRSEIISSIFGPSGVTTSDDKVTFEYRLQKTIDIYAATAPGFDKYFKDRIIPLLRSNFSATTNAGSTLTNWTNNNCESVNAILKHKINWKAQPLTLLVQKLYEVVKSQHHDVTLALTGQGDYILSHQFKPFQIPIDIWASITQDKRDRHYNKFKRQTALINSRTVTSTNGKLTVTGPTNGGKKPGQVKRKICAKTSSVNKRVRF